MANLKCPFNNDIKLKSNETLNPLTSAINTWPSTFQAKFKIKEPILFNIDGDIKSIAFSRNESSTLLDIQIDADPSIKVFTNTKETLENSILISPINNVALFITKRNFKTNETSLEICFMNEDDKFYTKTY